MIVEIIGRQEEIALFFMYSIFPIMILSVLSIVVCCWLPATKMLINMKQAVLRTKKIYTPPNIYFRTEQDLEAVTLLHQFH